MSNAAQKTVKQVKPQELPLACPTPDMALWSEHPRVFLPLDRQKEAICPYCSTRYVLDES